VARTGASGAGRKTHLTTECKLVVANMRDRELECGSG